MIQAFEARGKLMLTGEYFVLDGATSLALPTVFGQKMTVEAIDAEELLWKSLDEQGSAWFEDRLPISLKAVGDENPIARKLLEILSEARKRNPAFLNNGASVCVQADFDLQWGLGSSSTLIALVAQWAQIDPYALQFACFGGSGYDIACATANGPILYEKLPNPAAKSVSFEPSFTDQLFFVYLGQKQNSREGIQHYREMGSAGKADAIETLNTITQRLLQELDFDTFCNLLKKHEEVVGTALQTAPVQQRLFADFSGTIKSLGAWGGDFVLAASRMDVEETIRYFSEKGMPVVIPYSQMVL